MSDLISILDIAERTGYEASLITTFNASLPFYEEVILRRLRANGCRQNVVLMDAAQCSSAWDSEATRPRNAGYDYSLIPIRSSAAFHPKIAIFVGPKRASILIGSHNLTVAGFGYNRELTNLIELSAKKREDAGSILNDIWKSLATWLESALGYCPPELIQAALSLQKHTKPFLNENASDISAIFLSQTAGEIGLFAQLKNTVTFEVRRVLVIGAFFDEKLAFLKAIRSTWPGAEIVVGIDPNTVYLPTSLGDPKTRFVDVGTLWTEDKGRYIHAKAVYIEGLDERKIFISGSANPSGPGWGIQSGVANTEAMILLKDGNAFDALVKTGLDGLFGLLSIPSETLEATAAKASQFRISTQPSSPRIVMGTADADARKITVKFPDAQLITDVLPLDSDGGLISTQSTFTAEGSNVEIVLADNTGVIRSLLLKNELTTIARVIVHHTAIIFAGSASSKQHQIRVALGEIGDSGTDISRLIEQVSAVIFSGEVTKHATSVKRSAMRPSEKPDKDRPESLSMSVDEIAGQRRKRKLLEGGDLGYLLDILIQRLHIPKPSIPKTISDAAAGNPEEGQDDDVEPPSPSLIEDEAIAIAVFAKSRSLINKMLAREALAAAEPERVTEMLAQLTAVLAIIKELKHLEMQGRWRDRGFALVDPDAMYKLMTKSMFYLFSSTHAIWNSVENEAIGTEELKSLNVLLSWLAWEIGYDYEEVVPPVWTYEAPDSHDFALSGNGYLGKLFPRLIADDLSKSLEMAVFSTINPVPKERSDANAWINRCLGLGRTLRLGNSTNPTASSKNCRVGGFAYVPNRIEQWTVVLEVDEKLVKLWDFGQDKNGNLEHRGFMHSFVMPLQSGVATVR
ncbi:MAG: hypothetical protein JWQ42_2712 [Edaphobacter sp.]|nr:hypothetical protein [Edaphobacter sp.]